MKHLLKCYTQLCLAAIVLAACGSPPAPVIQTPIVQPLPAESPTPSASPVAPAEDEPILSDATAVPPIVPDRASGVSLIAFNSVFGSGDFEIFVIEPDGQQPHPAN